jgi:hypothetical protein
VRFGGKSSRGGGADLFLKNRYLHHTLSAPSQLMSPSRICHIWAYQLIRHPLLAAKVVSGSYEDVSFVYTPPSTLDSCLQIANDHLSYGVGGEIDLISTYLNDARVLSSDRLAMLFVVAEGNSERYQIMLCTTHYVGDGMALHTFMNEFYTLLGSDKSVVELAALIESQLAVGQGLPASLEDRLPRTTSKLGSAIGLEEYRRSESKLVGGQCFPRNPIKKPRHTVVPTFPYTVEETKAILAACKSHGVTIAHAMFALCNVAWARRTAVSKAHPWWVLGDNSVRVWLALTMLAPQFDLLCAQSTTKHASTNVCQRILLPPRRRIL